MRSTALTCLASFLLFFTCLASYGQPCNSSTQYPQATICQGTTYPFYGRNLDTAGTYNDTIVLAGGCDSIISLELFVIPTVYSYISGTVCPNSSYNFFGRTLTQAGTYYDTLYTSGTFCDSIIVLTLTGGSTYPTRTVYGSECSGYPFYFYGNYYYSGFSDVYVPNPSGCDSLISLYVSYYYNYTTYVASSSCSGQPYQYNGKTYAVPGYYYDTLTSVGGCDSLIYLELTATNYKYVSFGTCDSTYTYLGQTYHVPGQYYDTLTRTGSCDSIISIYLYKNTTGGTTYLYFYPCSSFFVYDGDSFAVPGGYYDTLTSVAGCDSIVYLDLTSTSPYSYLQVNTCASQYTYNGQSYAVPGYYYVTLTTGGGCDSIVYLDLYSYTPYSYKYIEACTSSQYTYNGQSYAVPGSYTVSLLTGGGCDSTVYLELSNGNPYTYIDYYGCTNLPYVYNGHSYIVPGYYTDTFSSVLGCDSFVHLELYAENPYSYLYYSGCTNIPYVYHGRSYLVPGYYTDTLTSVSGCDSFVYLDLYSSDPYSYQTFYSCTNRPFVYNGNSYTVPGNYTVPLLTPSGCDSSVYLELLAGTPTSTQYFYVCNYQPYTYNGKTYATPGYYADTLLSAGGCDSIVYLDFYYGSPYSYKTVYSCQSTYLYNGVSYAVPGSYNVTFTTATSCDSTVYLYLYAGSPSGFQTIYTCNSQYTYHGHSYAVPGTYRDTLTSSQGCDSLVYLYLYSGDPYSYKAVYTCSNHAYSYNGRSYAVPGYYADTLSGSSGCDSIVYLQLYSDNPYKFITVYSCPSEPYTYNGHSYAVPGFYTDTFATVGGCDSFVYLQLYNTTVTYGGYQYIYTCNNPVTVNGRQFSVPGSYIDTIKSVVSGCDSLIEDLYIYASNYDRFTLSDNGCAGSIYTFRAKNFVLPYNYTYSYYYLYDTVPSTTSCDTIFELELYLTPAPIRYMADSFCQGATYQYGSYSFTTAGHDTLYIPGPTGTCDTALYLSLTYKAGPAVPTVTQSGGFLIAVAPADLVFQWLLNGAPVTNGNSQVLSVSENGTYNVIVSDSGASACNARSADVYVRGLGISNAGGGLAYEFYPNPNSGRFTLTVPGYNGIDVKVLDVFGREIYEKQMSKESQTIDLDAADGTYILILKGNGTQAISKFVIAR